MFFVKGVYILGVLAGRGQGGVGFWVLCADVPSLQPDLWNRLPVLQCFALDFRQRPVGCIYGALFWGSHSVPSIYLSIVLPTPACLHFCCFIVKSGSREARIPPTLAHYRSLASPDRA